MASLTSKKAGVAKRLKSARVKAKLSQAELARKTSVSGAYVSRIEAGDRVPSLEVLRELADALGVSVDWLETGMSNGQVTASQRRLLEGALSSVEQARRSLLTALGRRT